MPLLRRNVGCVFQDFKLLPTALRPRTSPTRSRQGESNANIRRKVPEVLSLVGLSDKTASSSRTKPLGRRAAARLDRARRRQPSAALICDEPTGNLDPDTSVGIMQLLYRINRAGTTILMVTHDREMVDKMRRRVIALEDGRLARDERRGGYESE